MTTWQRLANAAAYSRAGRPARYRRHNRPFRRWSDPRAPFRRGFAGLRDETGCTREGKTGEPMSLVWLVIQQIANVEMVGVCSAHSTPQRAEEEMRLQERQKSPMSNFGFYVTAVELDPENEK